jgi:sialidase-1
MKKSLISFGMLAFITVIMSCKTADKISVYNTDVEFFEVQQIFNDERFPNVVVGTDGTVVTSWGRENFRVRRSEDGGKTWGPEITVANPGFQGGGTTVDENTGDILVFVEEGHPVAPLHVYRSSDQGKTWKEEEVTILPNSLGHIPSMHMNERGITLKYGDYAGRLIRPTRYYGGGNGREFWDEHYTNAIYSDDGGKTWQASEPFPAYGTGEAAIEELSDGTLYYNSRRHKSTDGRNPRMRYIAWSYDAGQTWEDLSVSDELPDGDQNRDYGLMAGLVRLPIEGHDILLFSNIESPEGRHHGTVWASFDGGKTWPVKRLVEEGSFAYSSMAAGRKGTPSEGFIFLFYESGEGAKMARFNLVWVTNGRDWREFIKD